MSEERLEEARRAALDEAERSERAAKRFFYAGGVFEAVVFVAILFVIDWGDPTHQLVFLCACLVYGPLAMGLLAMASHLDQATQRIIAALRTGVGD